MSVFKSLDENSYDGSVICEINLLASALNWWMYAVSDSFSFAVSP